MSGGTAFGKKWVVRKKGKRKKRKGKEKKERRKEDKEREEKERRKEKGKGGWIEESK